MKKLTIAIATALFLSVTVVASASNPIEDVENAVRDFSAALERDLPRNMPREITTNASAAAQTMYITLRSSSDNGAVEVRVNGIVVHTFMSGNLPNGVYIDVPPAGVVTLVYTGPSASGTKVVYEIDP